MRESIRKQLQSCVFANLNNYDEKTNTFFIPKYSKPKYDIGKCYLVKLPYDIINNTNHVLATNWNNGRAPQYKYYKIFVLRTQGTYIYVDSIAYDFENNCDINSMFNGYLDTSNLEQIGEL